MCSDVTQLQIENQELKIRVALLSEALAENFNVLSAADFFSDIGISISPRTHSVLKQYELIVADREYCAFDVQQWTALLSAIQPIVSNLIGPWTAEIADCDDFALIMNAYVAASFIKAGHDLQGAFFITWSRTHAYNAFVDDDRRVWVYEPQTGDIIGRLGATPAPYDTRKVMFIGARN